MRGANTYRIADGNDSILGTLRAHDGARAGLVDLVQGGQPPGDLDDVGLLEHGA